MSMFSRNNGKAEPSVSPLPQTPRSPAAMAWLDEHETLRQDNAFLRDELTRVMNELQLSNERSRRLEHDYKEIRSERDFLQRHDTAMLSHLHNIKLLIVSAEESAKATAYAPPGSGVDTTAERTAEAQQKIDDAAAELGKMFAPEQVNG